MNEERTRIQISERYRSTELEIVVTFDALLRDGVRDSLRLPPLEVSAEQIAEPPLEEWSDTSQEEQPDAPHGSPEPASWTLPNRSLFTHSFKL